jgi:hypothetical protein
MWTISFGRLNLNSGTPVTWLLTAPGQRIGRQNPDQLQQTTAISAYMVVFPAARMVACAEP